MLVMRRLLCQCQRGYSVNAARLDNFGQRAHRTHPADIPGPEYGEANLLFVVFIACRRHFMILCHSPVSPFFTKVVLCMEMLIIMLLTSAMQNTHATRRNTLMDMLAQHTAVKKTPNSTDRISGNTNESIALVVFSAPAHTTMSNDIPYRFRQQSDFLYLTGCEEGDSALLLTQSVQGHRDSVLFVRERDAEREMWDGPRTGVQRVPEVFGMQGDRMFEVGNFPKHFQ